MARRLPSAERAKLFIDPLKKKIAKLEKDKKKYVETHQAKNVDKYKQKLNSFDQEIKKLEKNIKENKISYDLEDL
jgi:23S rRNA maturation mini-RNase III